MSIEIGDRLVSEKTFPEWFVDLMGMVFESVEKFEHMTPEELERCRKLATAQLVKSTTLGEAITWRGNLAAAHILQIRRDRLKDFGQRMAKRGN